MPLDEHFRKGTVAATNVEPSQTSFRSKPVEERFTYKLAPFSHVSFIGSAVLEAYLVGHNYRFPPVGVAA